MRTARTRPPAWTAQEIAILDDLYPRAGLGDVADALPDRSHHAIQQMAHKRGLKSPIVADAPKTILAGARLEEAIRLHEAGWSMLRIARHLGFNEQATSNAILIALCPRRGFRPAERDATGRLTDESKDRLRYMLKKGLRHVEIQLRLGLSAARVAEERRRYNRDLRARDKAPLPPPGAGEQYCGVKIPAARRREVEAILMEGHGSTTAARRTGISKPSAKNIRARLVARLARKGEALPGCDTSGRRIGKAKESSHYIPAAAIADLRARLLAREPVARAARALGIGSASAYRIRDALAAELAARGEQLAAPIRLGRGQAYKQAARDADWLPADRLGDYRALSHEHGPAEAKRLLLARIDTEARAAAEAREAERRRPKSFEEQLALVAAGKATLAPTLNLRRPDPAMTLGGIASGAL